MGFGSFKKGTKKLKKAVAKLEKQRQEELQVHMENTFFFFFFPHEIFFPFNRALLRLLWQSTRQRYCAERKKRL